jgi:hypothetical protein
MVKGKPSQNNLFGLCAIKRKPMCLLFRGVMRWMKSFVLDELTAQEDRLMPIYPVFW